MGDATGAENVSILASIPKNAYLIARKNLIDVPVIKNLFAEYCTVGDLFVFHNCDNFYMVNVPHSERQIVVLGHLYNPFRSLVGSKAVDLLAISLSIGYGDFLVAVNELSGRFVLMVVSDSGITVIPDACASLPVAYAFHNGELVLSSHPFYIGNLLRLPDDPIIKSLSQTKFYRMGIRHCPADLTEVQGVNFLTPNLSLRCWKKGFYIQRIFPSSQRIGQEPEHIVEQVSQALKSAADCLVRFDKPIRCALSGGVDSRLTLAASVNQRVNFQFFTFAGEGNSSRDLQCTKKLSQDLLLKFEEISLGDEKPDEEFGNLYRRLQPKTRLANAQEVFLRSEYFGIHDAFEVRSSISEVTRNFIKRKFHIDKLPLASDYMVPLYKRVPFSMKWHNTIAQAFEAWIKRSRFTDVEKYGYDWLDFYYWELRVGTWQSLVLQDADYYTNPTVIFNNRKLLEMMLSSPEEYRKDDALQVMIMECMDADVLQQPLVKNFGRMAKAREFVESGYLKSYGVFLKST